MSRGFALGVVALLAFASPANAQQTPPRPTGPDTGRRVRPDTTNRDTLKLDLAPPDSIMLRLMTRGLYGVTRYQGDSVRFIGADRGFFLWGLPALVHRDSTKIRGDSIEYRDTPPRVSVWGSPGIMHDPSRGEPVRASEPMMYYLNEHRAVAGEVCTIAAEWRLCADRGAVVSDPRRALYGVGGRMTTDPDTENPHYHFRFGALKLLTRSSMVARPAVLYIGEVPVMWIPWLFQDLRSGRRSGILTPRLGVSEVVRNSPSYRRTVENLGYYFALSDYYDAEVSLDWRSGARPTEGDFGWLTLKGETQYVWRDRFLDGRVFVSRMAQNDGSTNLQLSWQHSQKFSQSSSLISNLNYTTSTAVLRQTTLNPLASTANITSTLNYQTRLGPFQTSIGGTARQFPGRDQKDLDFPTFNLTTKPLEFGWFTWSPSLNGSMQQSFDLDTPSEFAFRKVSQPDGTIDSVRTNRNMRRSSFAFNTPFRLGAFQINASVRGSDLENDFPEAKLVIDPADTSIKRTIVYQRTYLTQLDWDLGLSLPQVSQGKWNLVPSVTLQNVDPGGFIVRSERTGANYVSQSKRLSYGLSINPTFFGLFEQSVGAVSAFRHSLSPSISYSYSPAAEVSDEYLAALGRTRAGYLGSLAQNRVSLTINQTFEAKIGRDDDTSAVVSTSKKIKVLSLQFSPFEYDFERARVTGRSGFSTERFSYNVSSDLLPGFNMRVEYSLFSGSTLSDTARFSPYPEQITATLALDKASAGVGALARVWGWATGEPPQRDTSTSGGQAVGSTAMPPPVLGERNRSGVTQLPTGQPWRMSMTVSSARSRPVRGGNVIIVDPRALCEGFREVNPLQYQICLSQQSPTSTDLGFTQTTGGGPVYQQPPQTSVQAMVSFNLTPNWAAQWQTSYDVQRHEFASQMVNLQRDLRDWRASFGFTQAPNGNFAFNFLISLKPAPDIQLPYTSQSYRSPGATGQR